MVTAAAWYDDNPDLNQYYQGDICRDVPYFFFPNYKPESEQPRWKLLRPRKPTSRSLDEVMKTLPIDLTARAAREVPDRWQNPLGEYFVAVARRMTVMIVTRSCAIDRNTAKHYLVVPVFAFSDLSPGERSPVRLDSVRALDIFDWFYLPASDRLQEGFADLSQPMPVHWSFFGDAPRGNFVARLSAHGTSKLQEMFSDSFGTVFGFDHEDVCPQSTRYACSKCFYMGRLDVHQRTVQRGDAFGECPECGQDATWVKIPDQSIVSPPE